MSSIEYDFSEAKVLIVDDEPDIREILSEIVKETCPNIFTAEDGVAALEILKKEKIDVILSDLKMPRMDGIELLAEVQKLDLNLLTILISGFGDRNLLMKSIELKAFDFIEKPFDSHIVTSRLEKALSRKIKDDLIRDALICLLKSKWPEKNWENFHQLPFTEQEKTLNGVLSVMKLKGMKNS